MTALDRPDILSLPDRLDTAHAAEYLGLQPQTLALWRTQGRGPAYLRLGRAIRYDRQALDSFLRASTVVCGADAQAAR